MVGILALALSACANDPVLPTVSVNMPQVSAPITGPTDFAITGAGLNYLDPSCGTAGPVTPDLISGVSVNYPGMSVHVVPQTGVEGTGKISLTGGMRVNGSGQPDASGVCKTQTYVTEVPVDTRVTTCGPVRGTEGADSIQVSCDGPGTITSLNNGRSFRIDNGVSTVWVDPATRTAQYSVDDGHGNKSNFTVTFATACSTAPDAQPAYWQQDMYTMSVICNGDGTIQTDDGYTVPAKKGAKSLIPVKAGRKMANATVTYLDQSSAFAVGLPALPPPQLQVTGSHIEQGQNVVTGTCVAAANAPCQVTVDGVPAATGTNHDFQSVTPAKTKQKTVHVEGKDPLGSVSAGDLAMPYDPAAGVQMTESIVDASGTENAVITVSHPDAPGNLKTVNVSGTQDADHQQTWVYQIGRAVENGLFGEQVLKVTCTSDKQGKDFTVVTCPVNTHGNVHLNVSIFDVNNQLVYNNNLDINNPDLAQADQDTINLLTLAVPVSPLLGILALKGALVAAEEERKRKTARKQFEGFLVSRTEPLRRKAGSRDGQLKRTEQIRANLEKLGTLSGYDKPVIPGKRLLPAVDFAHTTLHAAEEWLDDLFVNQNGGGRLQWNYVVDELSRPEMQRHGGYNAVNLFNRLLALPVTKEAAPIWGTIQKYHPRLAREIFELSLMNYIHQETDMRDRIHNLIRRSPYPIEEIVNTFHRWGIASRLNEMSRWDEGARRPLFTPAERISGRNHNINITLQQQAVTAEDNMRRSRMLNSAMDILLEQLTTPNKRMPPRTQVDMGTVMYSTERWLDALFVRKEIKDWSGVVGLLRGEPNRVMKVGETLKHLIDLPVSPESKPLWEEIRRNHEGVARKIIHMCVLYAAEQPKPDYVLNLMRGSGLSLMDIVKIGLFWGVSKASLRRTAAIHMDLDANAAVMAASVIGD